MTDQQRSPQEIIQGLTAKEIIDGSSSNTTTSNLHSLSSLDRSSHVSSLSERLRSTVGPDEVRHGFWELLQPCK